MTDATELDTHPERFFQVCAEKCDECLFSKRRLVGGRRVKELVDAAIERDAHFICHKHSVRSLLSGGQISEKRANVCCRAYYDEIGDRVLVIRLARMLGIVVFVDQAGQPVADRSTDEKYTTNDRAAADPRADLESPPEDCGREDGTDPAYR
jgi:hypothetical protein